MTRWGIIVGALLLTAVIAAGGWWFNIGTTPAQRVALTYPEGVAAAVPLGFEAGGPAHLTLNTANPLGEDPNAVQEGKKLFRSMNCAGCHGYDGKGNMGPDLTDDAWRYGGTPVEVYKSIYEGRPQGMPAWGNTLPTDPIWQLVAYIQSLGGTFAPVPPGSGEPIPADQNRPQATGAQAGQSQ
ncbi:MAG: c-type cytochrome [Devosia sp.]